MLSRIPIKTFFVAVLLVAFTAGAFSLASAESRHGSHRTFLKHFDSERIVGSGVSETRTLDLADFEKLRVDGVADVTVRIGASFHVEMTTDDNLFDHVAVYVRNGELVVDENDLQLDTEEGIRLDIEMPLLSAIRIDGVGNVEAFDLENDELLIEVDGVGNISANGTAQRLEVHVDGVGEVMLSELVVQDADVSLDGVGDVTVNVEQSLDAQVDGMGTLRYYGDPEILRESVDGFGEIVALGS